MDESRRRHLRARSGAAITALILIGALVGVAEAQKPRVGSTVTAKERFDSGTFELVFYGRVHSSKPGCARNRTVELRVVNLFGGGPPISLGTDLTDENGRWEIRMLSDGVGGDYIARAKGKALPKSFCRSARSGPVDFGPPT